MEDKLVLLNPGPVNLTSRVRSALTKPDLCHREPEFSRLQSNIRSAILGVYKLSKKDYGSVLLTGSGTLAVESMITSLVPPNGKLLVVENGVYGERIKRIAQTHGMEHVAVAHQWGEELDVARIEAQLAGDGAISHVAAVHHETTTGRLNDLAAVGVLCRRHKKALLIDAVSSFGSEDIRFDEWGITACAASANKCLHGAPGVSFVVGRRASLIGLKAENSRSVYLDLSGYWQEQERGLSPFTHAVHIFYALNEALEELEEIGGQVVRKEYYQELASLIRDRADDVGLIRHLTSGMLACSLTAFQLPPNTLYRQLHDPLREAGFVIYAGQGDLSKTIFRIAHMGNVTENDIERLFVHLGSIV